jgi:beta-glucosidase
MSSEAFPEDFIWGAATSAYQIEGAVAEDGRGDSIWDWFCNRPGAIAGGASGRVACDHYHRWRDDIALMRALGLQAYRFSVAWPRVLPRGWGNVNSPGLDFYDRLVDALLDAGIEPWITLYHWDLPIRLEHLGGWTSRDTPKAFAEFADTVAGRLGDRVRHWVTINEPWVISVLGHGTGVHAPGRRDWGAVAASAHHTLLAHGWAMPAIRSHDPGSQVGVALNPAPVYPGSDHDRDLEAAEREDGLRNRLWLDPLAGRGYPADVVQLFDDLWPEIESGDLEAIAAPIDFLGVNYYSPTYVKDDPGTPITCARTIDRPDLEHTAMGWAIQQDAFVALLQRLHADYGFQHVIVTENGAAFDDPSPESGVVSDPRRVRYLHDHLQAILEVRESGVPVDGYFVWSLLDNFEWAEGYSKRFGIVYVDFLTMERTIKQSGRGYQRVIESNALTGLRLE